MARGRGDANLDVVIRGKDKSSRAFGRVQGRVAGLTRSLFSMKAVGVGIVGLFAGRAFRSIADAFGTQEKSVLALNQALRNSGQFSEEASERIRASASAIQAVTTAGDEAIIQATASLGELATGLNADELIQAQSAIVGIADTFLKGDLQGAALLVGKSIGSSTNALSRYGIQLDTTATQQEKLAALVDTSSGFFATSIATTRGLTGTLAQLSNAIGDIKETVGELALEIIGFDGANNNLVKSVQGFDVALKENREKIVFWGKVAIASVRYVASIFKNLVSIVFNVGQAIGASMVLSFENMRLKFETTLREIKVTANAVIESINSLPGPDISLSFNESSDAIITAGAAVTEAGKNFTKQTADIAAGVLDIVDAVNRFKTAVALAGDTLDAGPIGSLPEFVPEIPLGESGNVAGLADPNVQAGARGLRDVVPPELAEQEGELSDPLLAAADAVGELQDSFSALGKDAGGVITSLIGSEENLGKAAIETLKQMSKGKALFYAAEAVAALASGFFGNPLGFKAAAGFAEAAALHGGLAIASSAIFGGGGAAGGGSTLGSDVQSDAAASGGGPRGSATVIIDGDTFNPNDPRQADNLSQAINDLISRGYIDITVQGGN